MTTKVINPEGQFENWHPQYLHELSNGKPQKAVGNDLLYEDEIIRVWSIVLQPEGRLPFHRHTTNYSWTCLSHGKAVSRSENGEISEISHIKGDVSYYDHDTGGDLVHDLENVGNTTLIFTTVEYKR